MDSQRRPPTLDEVAARAGVGRGTASRAINASAHVSEATRTAVLKAVEDLGYVPNRAARALVTQATDTIALVFAESGDQTFGEPYLGRVVREVARVLAGTRRQLLVAVAGSDDDRARLDLYLNRQHVDGVLLLCLDPDDPMPDRLRTRGLPTVVVLGDRAGEPATPDGSELVRGLIDLITGPGSGGIADRQGIQPR